MTKKRKHKPYPIAKHEESGCKVGWLTYDKEEDAKTASKAARYNAEILAAQGYDFGYQAPGEIRRTSAGEFVVVIP